MCNMSLLTVTNQIDCSTQTPHECSLFRLIYCKTGHVLMTSSCLSDVAVFCDFSQKDPVNAVAVADVNIRCRVVIIQSSDRPVFQ